MKTLLVIQHVRHEGLGTFEAVFTKARMPLRQILASDGSASWPHAEELVGIVSMGGPQSVYEQARYPYLTREIELFRDAAKHHLPMLGVCLGAQLLAAALGAKVTKNPRKEIGWYPLMRETGAEHDPLWEIFGQTETVFQWHGDTFTLPKGAVQLASSPLCDQQAFRYGDYAYGIQGHLEMTEAMIRSWCTVNKDELATLRGVIDASMIQRQTPQHLPRVTELAQAVASRFVTLMETPSHARSR